MQNVRLLDAFGCCTNLPELKQSEAVPSTGPGMRPPSSLNPCAVRGGEESEGYEGAASIWSAGGSVNSDGTLWKYCTSNSVKLVELPQGSKIPNESFLYASIY